MKQQQNVSQHIKIGAIGEQLAANWFIDQGFEIVGRHYLKKWGEIDLVVRQGGIVHFIEVKSVSYETRGELATTVAHETYRPEENVHRNKLKRLYRAIDSWISEHAYRGEYQLDVVTVRMVPREKYAVVDCIENVFLE